MSIRGIGSQTLTGTAQPVFGASLTAASGPLTPDQFTNNTNPASSPSRVTLAVTSTLWFAKGDKVLVGTGNPGAPYDIGMVFQVVDATHLIVQGLTNTHASGEWVILSNPASRIRIRAGAAALYLGVDNTVGSSSTTVFDILNPGEVYDIGPSSVGNTYGTGQYWMQGASGTMIASATTI